MTHRSLMNALGIGTLSLAAAVVVEAHEPYRREVTKYRGPVIITEYERRQIAKQRHRAAEVRRKAIRDGEITPKEVRKIIKAYTKLQRRRVRAMDIDAHRGYRRHGDDRFNRWFVRERWGDRRDRRYDRREDYGWYDDRSRRSHRGTYDRYDRRDNRSAGPLTGD